MAVIGRPVPCTARLVSRRTDRQTDRPSTVTLAAHARRGLTTHSRCPLNPRNAPRQASKSQSAEIDDKEHDFEPDDGQESDIDNSQIKKRCASCGATDHARKSHKNCPKNPHNAPSTSKKVSSSESADTDEEPSEFEGFESDDGGVFSLSEFIPDKDSSSDEETAVEICDCGTAHKRDCPLNPRYRNAYSGKQKKQGTKKEQSSLSVRKGSFAIGTKGKGRAATVRQSETPSSNPPRRKRLFQKELDSHSLSLQSSAKRVCLPQRTVDPDSGCLLTEYEPCQDIVDMNPPDREWKEETMRYLERWSETSLE